MASAACAPASPACCAVARRCGSSYSWAASCGKPLSPISKITPSGYQAAMAIIAAAGVATGHGGYGLPGLTDTHAERVQRHGRGPQAGCWAKTGSLPEQGGSRGLRSRAGLRPQCGVAIFGLSLHHQLRRYSRQLLRGCLRARGSGAYLLRVICAAMVSQWRAVVAPLKAGGIGRGRIAGEVDRVSWRASSRVPRRSSPAPRPDDGLNACRRGPGRGAIGTARPVQAREVRGPVRRRVGRELRLGGSHWRQQGGPAKRPSIIQSLVRCREHIGLLRYGDEGRKNGRGQGSISWPGSHQTRQGYT